MIKLIPPSINFTTIETAQLVAGNFEMELIPYQIRLHHFLIPKDIFQQANSIRLIVNFKDGSQQTYTKLSKYNWVFDKQERIGLRSPFKINENSSYKNTKEDKTLISEALNEKYLQATNATIGKKGKQNLLYYSVGGDKQYFELLKQSIESIFEKISVVNFDVLFIAPQSWVNDIESIKPANAVFKYHIVEDSIDGIEISKNKTKIFEFSEINKYNKILFLDADILAARDLRYIFAAEYEHEKLYVKVNKQRVTFSSHAGSYHGLRHLSPEQVDEMKANNQLPFNAGQFLFLNSNKMRKHFENLNWLMSVWPGPYFFEQSFMNHYFCLYNLTENQKFGIKVKLISTVESHMYNPNLDNDDILVHFIAPALNATAKVNFILEYKNAYFPQ